jgi:transposase-like protein
MIFPKKRKFKERDKYANAEVYFVTLERILQFVNQESDFKGKISLLDYYIKIIKKDVIADNLSTMIKPEYILFTDEQQNKNLPKSVFFQRYYLENGEIISCEIVSDISADSFNIIDTVKAFDDVYTDGAFWYHKYNSNDKDLVEEYRLAILYTLAKLKYFFENNAMHSLSDRFISFKDDTLILSWRDFREWIDYNSTKNTVYRQ